MVNCSYENCKHFKGTVVWSNFAIFSAVGLFFYSTLLGLLRLLMLFILYVLNWSSGAK